MWLNLTQVTNYLITHIKQTAKSLIKKTLGEPLQNQSINLIRLIDFVAFSQPVAPSGPLLSRACIMPYLAMRK